MAEDINYLYRLLNDYKRNLTQKRREKGEYLAVANEIAQLYNRLKNDKNTVNQYKNDSVRFKNVNYPDFIGNQFSANYAPSIDDIVSQYNELIRKMDNNLDALNNARLDFERKAYACDGPIGRLINSINYVYRKIQNMTN